MGQSILDKIQAKLELLRLEKRYTRSRHRRSGFVSNAVYVDGEYVYQTPNSTGSSTSTTATGGIDALHGEKAVHSPVVDTTTTIREDPAELPPRRDPQWKRFSRFSISTSTPTATATTPAPEVQPDDAQRRRLNRYSSMPGFGGTYDATKSAPRVQERRLSMIR